MLRSVLVPRYVVLFSSFFPPENSWRQQIDIFQMSKTNELLHDERSLLYLMSDLYIVDDVVM